MGIPFIQQTHFWDATEILCEVQNYNMQNDSRILTWATGWIVMQFPELAVHQIGNT